MDVRVDFDFSDVGDFLNEGTEEVRSKVDEIGGGADEYDAKDGTYQDHTETLRKSNKHVVEDDCSLTLYNDAADDKGYHYASNVESKGFRVRSGGALYAGRRLKEEFDK